MPTFRDLFIEHVGAALERQLDLEDRIGPVDWHLDMPNGTIAFDTPGDPLKIDMQVLGSEADASAMWIAAWSLDPKKMPTALAEASRKVRAMGGKDRIPELANARVPLEEVDGEKYSLVATSLLKAPGYYRAPFAGGAMFVLLLDPSLVTKVERPSVRMVDVFWRVAQIVMPAEQKRAFAAYAKHHGGKVIEEPGKLTVTWKDEKLTAKVDVDGSVFSLDAG